MAPLTEPVKVYLEPELVDPYLVAAWPGIGNIGIATVSYLKDKLEAEGFAEIESHGLFPPHSVTIEKGVIKDLRFPRSLFFYKKGVRDLVIFLGEMQPTGEDEVYQLANHVLDVAQHFGVKRVYTAGAAVAAIHHTMRSKVWAIPNGPHLLEEARRHNTVLMSQMGDRDGQGNITGLNGLLLGVARKRGMEGFCFLGEVPIYVANFPVPYPKASRAILDVLAAAVGISIDLTGMDFLARRAEQDIERVYAALPDEVRQQLDKFKVAAEAEMAAAPEPITDADKEKIMKDIEDFFGKGKGKGTQT